MRVSFDSVRIARSITQGRRDLTGLYRASVTRPKQTALAARVPRHALSPFRRHGGLRSLQADVVRLGEGMGPKGIGSPHELVARPDVCVLQFGDVWTSYEGSDRIRNISHLFTLNVPHTPPIQDEEIFKHAHIIIDWSHVLMQALPQSRCDSFALVTRAL